MAIAFLSIDEERWGDDLAHWQRLQQQTQSSVKVGGARLERIPISGRRAAEGSPMTARDCFKETFRSIADATRARIDVVHGAMVRGKNGQCAGAVTSGHDFDARAII